MHPWERRLKDVGHILTNCEQTYFDPETFRINSNQFLQTARTVTFIIQKNKDSIPNFESWYEAHVYGPWSADQVMVWARDSRNKIEKQGDLDLHSSVEVRLIFSYLDEEDILLPSGSGELLAGVKRLLRFARSRLPSGVSDAAVIKIDRKWVANTLEDWELVHAMTYIYARAYDACAKLASHLGHRIADSIPHPTLFDPLSSDARKTRYLKLNDTDLRRVAARHVARRPQFTPPPPLASFVLERAGKPLPRTLSENVDLYAGLARLTFDHFGNHAPMLFMFDEHWRQMDFVSTAFDDQASKYLFWRTMCDRVLYLKPSSLVWVCEAWIRDFKDDPLGLIRNMPIIGENLHVVGIDRFGGYASQTFSIRRDSKTGMPRLEGPETESGSAADKESYLIPIMKAFQKVQVDACK